MHYLPLRWRSVHCRRIKTRPAAPLTQTGRTGRQAERAQRHPRGERRNNHRSHDCSQRQPAQYPAVSPVGAIDTFLPDPLNLSLPFLPFPTVTLNPLMKDRRSS